MFELVGGQQVGFVDDENDGLVALVGFGSEQVLGLADQRGTVEARGGAQGDHDVVVDAAGPDHRVGEVDDGVPGGVQAGHGGTCGHGLAGADLAADHADVAVVDQPGDAGDGFLVGAGGEQLAGGQVAVEGLAGEAVVGTQLVDGHSESCSSLLRSA